MQWVGHKNAVEISLLKFGLKYVAAVFNNGHKWTLETCLSEKITVLWSEDNLERTYISLCLYP